MNTWFDDIPVIGNMTEHAAAQKLSEMDDMAGAETLGADVMRDGSVTFATPKSTLRSGGWKFLNTSWKHTSHAFGYIAPFEPGQKALQPITYAGNMKAQDDLKNQPITITLQRLRVKDYPGGGLHHILFDFYAENQVPGAMEELHFNATYRAQEGEEAAVVGFPIFVGLNVGAQGVAFRCYTVNVKNDGDEALLGFLDSGVFKSGLKLATTAQPALKPLSAMACGMTRAIAQRNRNVAVQDFNLGLDFSNTPTGARLAEGAYVAAQIPGSPPWDWDAYAYNPNTGQIIDRDDNTLLPFNYVVFGVSRYDEH